MPPQNETRSLTTENLQSLTQAFDIMLCPKSKKYKLFLSGICFGRSSTVKKCRGPAAALDQGRGETTVFNIKPRALGSAFCLAAKPAASKILHLMALLSVEVRVQGLLFWAPWPPNVSMAGIQGVCELE